MNYCVVEDGIIVNIIVCENDDIASMFGALRGYDGANIGDTYIPPEPAPEPEPTPYEPDVWDELAEAYKQGVQSAYDE